MDHSLAIIGCLRKATGPCYCCRLLQGQLGDSVMNHTFFILCMVFNVMLFPLQSLANYPDFEENHIFCDVRLKFSKWQANLEV